jgi:menaquinone-9 beta-reductase
MNPWLIGTFAGGIGMNKQDYDLITVGGGLAGSALAIAMAKHGARVLVIEREEAFKDRVRGEGITPWGVAEAQAPPW